MGVAGYDRAVLFGFLEQAGKFNEYGELRELNDKPVRAEDQAAVMRWRSRAIVPVSTVDRLLMRHGLMTWELEHWGTVSLGDDGFRPSNYKKVLAK